MVIPQDTKAKTISDTVEFRHQTIPTPVVTPGYRILHGLTTITDSLTDVPTGHSDAQLKAISALRDATDSWATPDERPDPSIPIPRHTPAQTRCANKTLKRKLEPPFITHQTAPRVPNKMARHEPAPSKLIHQRVPAPSPRVNPKETSPEVYPIARHTRLQTQNTQPPIAMRTRA